MISEAVEVQSEAPALDRTSPALSGELQASDLSSPTSSPTSDWRRIALQAGGVWLATRVAFLTFTYIAVLFASQGFDPGRMGLGPSFSPHQFLESWNQWDTGWYLPISNTGYEIDPHRAAFFPLYPLLIHVVTLVTGDHYRLLVAMIIGNLGALLAYVGLALLATREIGEKYAMPTLLVFSAYPYSFFTAAAYPDALFLGLAVFSIYFARRGQWYASAGCAFLAGLSRPTGLILVLPLLWEFASQHGVFSGDWRKKLNIRSLLQGVLVAAAVPLAIGLFALHLGLVLGNPLLFVDIQSNWAHQFMPFWDLPALAYNSIVAQPAWSFNQAHVITDFVPIVVFLVLILLGIKRLPATLTILALCALLLTIASPLVTYFDPFASAGRYLLAAFPAFLLLGKWATKYAWLNGLVLSGGWMVQAVFALFFLMGGWMV